MKTARRPWSLQARLVAGLGVLLVAVAIAVALALDAYYRDLDLRARRDVLEAQVLALIATAEIDAAGALVPGNLADPRLATPGSGLYALIRDGEGRILWRSPSLVGASFALGSPPVSGARALQALRAADGSRLLALTLGVRWQTGGGAGTTFAISAVQSLEPHFRETRRVRLWILAGSSTVIAMLLIGLAVTLRLALRPLRELERQIEEVEAGRRERLAEGYPRELAGVTGNLNALLGTERNRLDRYRTTLGNLAHSLKTPLAALKSLLEAPGSPDRAALVQQADRMQDIVEHQLRRAVHGGAGVTLASLPLARPLDELREALCKVYRDRHLAWTAETDPELAYPIDRGDFMELAGSLLDNACKYGSGRVHVRATARPDARWRRPGLELTVVDDGPGIPGDERARVLERGQRADQRRPGQGIGLAVAQEIVTAYGGSLELGTGAQGGARVTVLLPGR